MAGSVPENVIVMWPKDNSGGNGIPTGWTRETNLDSKMVKGVASATTNAGTPGGGSSHQHTSSSHTHNQASHTHGGGTATATPIGNVWWNTQGSLGNSYGTRYTHSHSFTTGAATSTSGGQTFSWSSSAIEPEYYEVIYIKSDGTGDGFPDDCIVYWDSGTDPTNWTQHAASVDKYFRGAGSGGNGGGSGGNATHTHDTGNHTHNTGNHSHAATNTSNALGGHSPRGGQAPGFGYGNSNSWTPALNHPHTVAATGTDGSVTSAAQSSSGSSGTSTNNTILSTKMNAIQNTSGGSVWLENAYCLWIGNYADIDDSFTIADGNNSTRNLLSRFILNEPANNAGHGDPTGSLTHSHSSTGHTHSAQHHGHSGNPSIGNADADTTQPINTTSGDLYIRNHGHGTDNYGLTSYFSSNNPVLESTSPNLADNTTAEPAHVAVLYIKSGEEPVSGGDAIGFGANW